MSAALFYMELLKMQTDHLARDSHILEAIAIALRAMQGADNDTKTENYSAALNILVLYAAREHCCPKASLNIGVLLHHMGKEEFNNNAINVALQYFRLATKSFNVAASMIDFDGDLSPAQAKNSLAQYCEDGITESGVKDMRKAFELRREAALAGLAEAQFNLAIMYYRGEGTQDSLTQARKWLERAYKNRQQLSPEVQARVAAELVKVEIGCIRARFAQRPLYSVNSSFIYTPSNPNFL